MKKEASSRPVAIWLLIGIAMLIIQVSLGGITRLTGSGLSITEWKPIMGSMPPINDREWNDAFNKYKQIAQYKYVNSAFTLGDFKSIFFWEWFHRLWARLIGVAFLIPFIIFLFQRRIKKGMIRPLAILFFLGLLQALVGWIMVKSGLEDSDRLYVSHYRLAIHFILALVLISYALWFALEILVPASHRLRNTSLKRTTGWLIALLTLQLVYGAFMAGLKAAPYAATWPDINGSFFPHGGTPATGVHQLFDNPITVHFIHRSLAYLLLIFMIVWFVKAGRVSSNSLFKKTRVLPLVIVIVQIILGIVTVLNSTSPGALLWLGVTHQFVAMMFLLSLVAEYYLLSGREN